MPWDIQLPVEWNGRGDIAAVGDGLNPEQFWDQVVAVSTYQAASEVSGLGDSLTANDVRQLEGAIEDKVFATPYVTGRPDVAVTAVSDRQITTNVRLPRGDTTIEASQTIEI